MPLNIYICGQKHFGAEAFQALQQAGHHIVGVSSPERNAKGELDRLAQVAQEAGVPWMKSGVLTTDNLPAGVDVIVAAYSHDFINAATRAKTRLGAIGYHPSLLPLHRGKDAVEWTIRMGDKITGGTVYWLDEVMDGGPVAAQEHVFVLPGDTAAEIWRRDLSPLGIKLLTKVCNDLANGIVIRQIQNESIATVEPSIRPKNSSGTKPAA